MSDYDSVRAELERGTSPDLLCVTCPWDRLCITPPTMTSEEVKRRIRKAEAQDDAHDPGHRGPPMGMLLTALTVAGKDTSGQLCPVFALRLRGPDGRQVAEGVRALMREGVGNGQEASS